MILTVLWLLHTAVHTVSLLVIDHQAANIYIYIYIYIYIHNTPSRYI